MKKIPGTLYHLGLTSARRVSKKSIRKHMKN
jgi:hypothetical protein